MSGQYNAGRKAAALKGTAGAIKWLLLRRLVQLGVFAMFLSGPLYGVWIAKGNLASSKILETIPLSDPMIQLQSWIAGHAPETDALLGAAIVLALYVIIGGRSFCSWVCPVNPITDLAHWLRQSLGLKGGIQLSRTIRYWLLGVVFLAAAITGTIAWELINPVTMALRAAVFGIGFAWAVLLAVFLLDVFVGNRSWCGHLCPVGAFYSGIGLLSVLRVGAPNRANCDDCMDCYAVCPEPQVIRPALKGTEPDASHLIRSPNCTNCGRCVDVCPEDVFTFTTRFDRRTVEPAPAQSRPSGNQTREAA